MRVAIGSAPQALHEPRFQGNESAYLQDCLDSTFVSSVGPFVDRFESELAEYTGARHAITVVNGTAALHVALLLAGVERDDEVLIPALSFVATANAVHYCGAVPHFVDSDERTLGMDPVALRRRLEDVAELRAGGVFNRQTGRRIRTIVPMHTFGHPSDVLALLEVARDFSMNLVEDSAESLGSFMNGQHTGTFGLLGVLSFNGNKTITTGGGGAILTDDSVLARRAKHLTTTAKVPHLWEYIHDEVGFNYRLPNLNAALGCAQMEQLPDFLGSKRRLYERYQQAFEAVAGVSMFREPEGSSSNYWLQALVLDESNISKRDSLLTGLNEAGFMSRPAWMLLNRLAPYAGCPAAPLPTAEYLQLRVINLPSSAGLA
jgi:perosamine synthetase